MPVNAHSLLPSWSISNHTLPGLVSVASALIRKDALLKVTLRGISIADVLFVVEPCKLTSTLEKPPAKTFTEPVVPFAETNTAAQGFSTSSAMKRKTAPRLCRCIVSSLYTDEQFPLKLLTHKYFNNECDSPPII